jgi:hypothetical protein
VDSPFPSEGGVAAVLDYYLHMMYNAHWWSLPDYESSKERIMRIMNETIFSNIFRRY